MDRPCHSRLWRIAVTVPAAAVPAFEQALEPFALAISIVDAGTGRDRRAASAWVDWKSDLWLAEACIVEAVTQDEPDRAQLTAVLAVAAASLGLAQPTPLVEPLPERDWVVETQRRTPPIRIGRYEVRGSHVPEPVTPGRIGLVIDAALAFGTGDHATTRSCLAALDWLARRRRVRRALDMGSGTGILAIAAARTWRCPVLAADIDPQAVRVARENVRINHARGRVRACLSDGYRAPAVRAGRPYDLVTANILARPLIRQAPALARHLRRGGVAVLAGFLAWQEPAVRAAQRRRGLRLVRRFRDGDWGALVVRR